MSLEIPVEVDNQAALQAFKDLSKSLDALTSVFSSFSKEATKGFEATAKGAKKAEKEVGKLGKGFKGLKLSTKQVVTSVKAFAAGVAGLVTAQTGFSLAVYKLAGAYSNLKTEMGRARSEGEAGVASLQAIDKFAVETGISIEDLRSSYGALLENFDASSAENVTKMLSDIAANSDMGSKDILRMAESINEFANKSSLGAADIRKFARESNISVAALSKGIATATNRSINEVERLIASGNLSVTDLLSGAQSASGADALGAGALANALDDPMAQIARLGNMWLKFKEDIATSLFTEETTDSIRAIVDAVGEMMPQAIEVARKSLQAIFDAFTWLSENAKEVKAGIAAVATTAAILLAPTIWGAVTAFGALASATWAAMAPLLPFIALAVAVGAAIGALVYYWDDVVEAFKAGGAFIMDLFNAWWEHVTTFPGKMLQMGKDIIKGLINGLKSGPAAIGKAIKDLAGSIIGPFKRLLGIASPSKLFKEFGLDTAEGFEIGLKAGTPDVSRATTGLVDVPNMVTNSSTTRVSPNITINLSGVQDPAGVRAATDNHLVPALMDALSRIQLQGV